MRVPRIRGVIRRRILVNFRVDPEVVKRQLPKPFRPKLHRGDAVAGVCLIRLEQIRPTHVPAALGIASENAAHRIAVVWDEEGHERDVPGSCASGFASTSTETASSSDRMWRWMRSPSSRTSKRARWCSPGNRRPPARWLSSESLSRRGM
jgi:hypothetical protein